MSAVLKTAIVCAALMSLPVAESRAATLDFGVITGTPGNNSRSWNNTVTGSFTDYASFSTTGTADIASSITNSYGDASSFINDLTLSLYRGFLGSGTLVGSTTSTDGVNPPGTQVVDFTWFDQSAGNYYLAVSGTASGTASYGGSLGVTLSTVPLPSSAPLFGAALLIVSAVGYGAKRKADTLTA